MISLVNLSIIYNLHNQSEALNILALKGCLKHDRDWVLTIFIWVRTFSGTIFQESTSEVKAPDFYLFYHEVAWNSLTNINKKPLMINICCLTAGCISVWRGWWTEEPDGLRVSTVAWLCGHVLPAPPTIRPSDNHQERREARNIVILINLLLNLSSCCQTI